MNCSQSNQIRALFDEALVHFSRADLDVNKTEFLISVANLKTQILFHFEKEPRFFSYERCLSLAQSTRDLTNNLMQNEATLEHIEQFKRANKPFFRRATIDKAFKIFGVLCAIASYVVVGFCLAGPVGAVIFGGAIGTGIAVMSYFSHKQHEVEKVEQLASGLVKNRKPNVAQPLSGTKAFFFNRPPNPSENIKSNECLPLAPFPA